MCHTSPNHSAKHNKSETGINNILWWSQDLKRGQSTKMADCLALTFPGGLHFFGSDLNSKNTKNLMMRHCHHIYLRIMNLRIFQIQSLRFGVQNICPRHSSGSKDALGEISRTQNIFKYIQQICRSVDPRERWWQWECLLPNINIPSVYTLDSRFHCDIGWGIEGKWSPIYQSKTFIYLVDDLEQFLKIQLPWIYHKRYTVYIRSYGVQT